MPAPRKQPFFLRWLSAILPRPWLFRYGIRLFGPYLGTGIRLSHVSPDLRTFRAEMHLRPWNRNYLGTHFGGSLYSMCDPWFMLILLEAIGDRFVVWDKAGAVRYRRPGRGKVSATFHVPPERLAAIEARMAEGADRIEELFTTVIVDANGEVVAEVDKTISIRTKGGATTP